MTRYSKIVIATLLFSLFVTIRFSHAAESPTKIVLIAGPITGHPKDSHEYEKNVILLKHLLETSSNVSQVNVEIHFQGWPKDESTLNDAATIVLISDGGDRNLANHPLYVGERLKVLEKQMRRGCGFVQFHWTTFNPAKFHDQITEWVGGYFDYETGNTPNKWFSAIKTWDGPTTLPTPDHPICRGVKPFRVKEEFYYNIRFRDNDRRVTPIVATEPPGEGKSYPVGWAVQREDGGRGFGFTGGHFYRNWWIPDFRKLVLNAILWTAKREVPTDGVESKLEDPFRALIVTGHNHPAHDWRKVTAALIPVIEQEPRVIVDVTENVEDLGTDKIDQYDVLVMNYCNWDRQGLSDKAKKHFVEYLRKGGGLSVIHFANGSFTDTLPNKESDWPEYRTKIVRRIWVHGEGQSGHDAFGQFRVSMTGEKHPITAGLKPFDTMDELYFRQQGELPITPLATAKSRVTGNDEPMAWAYDYEKGRIFQTVLGHGDASVRFAGALIRRGTVWAAKREQLSFDPPPEATENTLFRDGSPWTFEQSLKASGAAAPSPAAPVSVAPSQPVNPLAKEGKFGGALDARSGGVIVQGRPEYRTPPLTVELWAKLNGANTYNILIANDSKASSNHWELFTEPTSGHLAAYLPGMTPDHVRTKTNICDGKWHRVAMIYEPARVRIFVDGKVQGEQTIKSTGGPAVDGDLAIGTLVLREIGCNGLIDHVAIHRGVKEIGSGEMASKLTDSTIGQWRFDELVANDHFDDESPNHGKAVLAVKKK